MSGTQPYIDTDQDDHDVPLDIEGRAYPNGICHMCGFKGPVFDGAVELPDGKGGWTYELGRRCVETDDCRKRRHTPVEKSLSESTPPGPPCTILPGQSGSNVPPEDPGPIQPPEPTPPDATEAPDGDWHF